MQISVTRGPVVESAHHVDVAVVGPDGPVLGWGEWRRPTIARSSLKFFQALPLLRSGAATAFEVDDDELVLACSSHSAEPRHVEAVAAWLARIGLDADHLECGPDLPINTEAARDVLRAGGGPAPLLNCCSGKHAGFLTVARHLDLDPRGYIEPGHPVQRLVTEAVEELCEVDLSGQEPGRDGCGIPTHAIPLDRLAGGMSRLVDAEQLDGPTAAASARLVDAVPSRAWWISGTGRHETRLADAASEPLLVKGGAEGVMMAALPDRRLGLAAKAADGAGRAAEVAIAAALHHLGAVSADAVGGPVANKAGTVVGTIGSTGEPPVELG